MAFSPTRKIIGEFIGVFLIGAVAGGLVTWKATDTQLTTFMSRSNDPDSMVARMNKKYVDEYHLTPDELNKIQPLVKEMAQHVYQVRHQFGVDIMATLDDYHQKIAAELTPEHRDAYLKAIADRRNKLNGLLLPDQKKFLSRKLHDPPPLRPTRTARRHHREFPPSRPRGGNRSPGSGSSWGSRWSLPWPWGSIFSCRNLVKKAGNRPRRPPPPEPASMARRPTR